MDTIDKDKLWNCIEMLCRIRKIEWTPAQAVGKTEDGKDIMTFSYPNYPSELYEVFQLMEPDYQYVENMKSWPKGLSVTDMSAEQIRTKLTALHRGERFCDGTIAAAVETGQLLKLLLRLDDLLMEKE